jgi:glycosyltransferase involved in cell wall biosynthesis
MEDVVQMYSALDLYVVGSRVEGGPQSITRVRITKTPIVSTDVGIARKYF